MLTARAPAAPASASCENALIVHEWRADLARVNGSSPRQAIAELRRIIAWQKAAAADATLDQKARDTQHKLWSALRDFDLRRLYQTLPAAATPPWRALNLRFHLANGRYQGVLSGPKHVDAPLSKLGDTRFRLAMRPKNPSKDTGDDRYELQSHIRTNIGPMRWHNLRRSFGLSLDRLVVAAPVAAPLARQSAGVARNPKLGRADQPILAQLWTGFPASAGWLAGWAQVDSLRRPSPAKTRARHLHLVVSLDPGRLQTAYPAVASYVSGLRHVIDVRTVVQSALGRLLTVELDSSRQRLTVDGWVAHGRLVPARDGRPVVGRDSSGLLASNGHFETVTDTTSRSFGIRVAIRHQRMRWAYRHDDSGAHFIGRLRDKPDVSVTGRAFGIIPVGLLEALSPVSMQQVMGEFMNTLIASDNGRGALVRFDVSDNSKSNNMVSTETDADILDNFFVRFGVKLANQRLLPDGKALDGLRRMAADGTKAYEQDLNRRAQIHGADSCPAMTSR